MNLHTSEEKLELIVLEPIFISCLTDMSKFRHETCNYLIKLIVLSEKKGRVRYKH